MDILKEKMRALYKGTKGDRTMFLDAGMKMQRLTVEPGEAQFVETRQHQVEEMCRWYGVPPHKVQHLLHATFSNIEHQSIEVVVDSILPWVHRLEEEADYKVFGQNRAGFFTKMNVDGLLRGDFQARTNGYRTLWGIGALTINEIRDMEGRNPIGPDGDKRIVPTNMTTLERLGEEPPAQQGRAPGPGDGGDQTDDEVSKPPGSRLIRKGKANGVHVAH
jgi:HK97 family phage portal protein